MTVREIEETLQTLEKRHPGLNEVMLVTLLRAGGWEEKQVEEARILFRTAPIIPPKQLEISGPPVVPLPPVQEEPVFEPVVDENHRLTQSETEIKQVVLPEEVSLVSETTASRISKRDELPHNLPLRPFETSDHVWSFSRYRDVFYGESEQEKVSQPQPLTKTAIRQTSFISSQNSPGTPVSVSAGEMNDLEKEAEKERIKERVLERTLGMDLASEHAGVAVHPTVPVSHFTTHHDEVKEKRTADEKLVILACVMLLAVLLLLGYMYSNGRL